MDESKNRRLLTGAALALVLVAVLALIYFAPQNPGLEFSGKQRSEELLNADLRMHDFFSLKGNSYGMAIGEEAKFSLSMTSSYDGVNATAVFKIPAGFEVLDGGRVWNGMLSANKTAAVDVMVRAVKVGVWNATVNVTSMRGGLTYETDPGMSVCVGVTREDLGKECGS